MDPTVPLPLLLATGNSFTAAVTDIDEPIVRDAHAVDWFAELFLERSPRGAWWQRFVIYFTQGNSVGSPTTLKSPRLGIQHDEPFVQVTVRDVQIVGVLVEFGRSKPSQ